MTEGHSLADGSAAITRSLHTWAESQPDAPCLTWVGDDGTESVWTYRELSDAVRRFAASVSTRAEPGVPVALLAANDVPSVVAMLGILDGGYCCLVLNPADPPARTRILLDAAGAELVFRSPAATNHADAIPADELLPADQVPARDAPPPVESRAFIFPTSGSTADSKLVVQSHLAALSNAEGVRRHHRLAPGTTILGGLPIHHVNGVHFTLIGVLHAGAHVVLPQSISPFAHLDLLTRSDAVIASVVPSVLDVLASLVDEWSPPPGFRYFVTAAAPLQSRTARRVHEQFGARIVQAYGLTETINFSTTMPVDLADEDYRRLVLDATLPPIGVAFYEQQIAVLDEHGDPVPEGTVGELCMRGPNLLDEYLGNPEATAQALAGDWFHTGDLGYAEQDGEHRYFRLTGRAKNVAKVRGESVSLEEIERRALEVPGVRDAGATSVEDSLEGERIVLLLVGADEVLAAARAHLAETLPPLHQPREWTLTDRIPRTPTGKILRRQLNESATPS